MMTDSTTPKMNKSPEKEKRRLYLILFLIGILSLPLGLFSVVPLSGILSVLQNTLCDVGWRRSIKIAGIAVQALLLFLSASPAGSASNSTATGDLILAPEKIYLDPWYSGDSQDCARNVTLLKEGYMLSIDSLNFTSIPAKDGMWGRTIWISNFTLYKNGEAVKRSYLTHGDIVKEINLTYGNIFYYNKTIDGKEYTFIEAKLDAILLTEFCGTVLVILRPFYQYSDGTGAAGQEIPVSSGGTKGTSKTPAASPAETHKVSPAEKSAGFEAALAIIILQVAYIARRK